MYWSNYAIKFSNLHIYSDFRMSTVKWNKIPVKKVKLFKYNLKQNAYAR